MKQYIIIILIFIIFETQSCMAKILQGNVAYNVNTAKELAFDGIEMQLDKNIVKEYLYDENNKQNREALKTGKLLDGRSIMSFCVHNIVKGYVIVYDDKPEYSFYYTTGGYLAAVDIDKHFDKDFPYRIGKYNPITGKLVSIGVYISEEEQYAYTKDGKLKAHWIGEIGYNAKGKPIAKRAVTNEIPQN